MEAERQRQRQIEIAGALMAGLRKEAVTPGKGIVTTLGLKGLGGLAGLLRSGVGLAVALPIVAGGLGGYVSNVASEPGEPEYEMIRRLERTWMMRTAAAQLQQLARQLKGERD